MPISNKVEAAQWISQFATKNYSNKRDIPLSGITLTRSKCNKTALKLLIVAYLNY